MYVGMKNSNGRRHLQRRSRCAVKVGKITCNMTRTGRCCLFRRCCICCCWFLVTRAHQIKHKQNVNGSISIGSYCSQFWTSPASVAGTFVLTDTHKSIKCVVSEKFPPLPQRDMHRETKPNSSAAPGPKTRSGLKYTERVVIEHSMFNCCPLFWLNRRQQRSVDDTVKQSVAI